MIQATADLEQGGPVMMCLLGDLGGFVVADVRV
eukprot:COSAG01_NODE_65171_length_274_cov_0.588571_1_plen_32_part_10